MINQSGTIDETLANPQETGAVLTTRFQTSSYTDCAYRKAPLSSRIDDTLDPRLLTTQREGGAGDKLYGVLSYGPVACMINSEDEPIRTSSLRIKQSLPQN